MPARRPGGLAPLQVPPPAESRQESFNIDMGEGGASLPVPRAHRPCNARVSRARWCHSDGYR